MDAERAASTISSCTARGPRARRRGLVGDAGPTPLVGGDQADHLSALVSELVRSMAPHLGRTDRDGMIARVSLVLVQELATYLDAMVAPGSGGNSASSLGPSPSTPRSAPTLPTSAEGTAVTARQLEVLDHLRQGRRPPEIARLLCLSEATVRTHIRDACHRLQVNRWFAAVSEAQRLGLLP